jgi:hypothetical protein
MERLAVDVAGGLLNLPARFVVTTFHVVLNDLARGQLR